MTTNMNSYAGGLAAPGTSVQAFGLKLVHLRWMATIVPAVAVIAYETARHEVFDHRLHIHDLAGNFVTGGVALLFCYLFATAIFRSVEHAHRRAVEETGNAAALSSMVEERERLSRELHDGLAQVVSYVLVRLDTVRGLVEAGETEHAAAELESLRLAVDNVNVDVRESISGLRSRVVERGLVQALSDYLEEYEERYGIRTELEMEPGIPRLSPDADLQLFRMVQEALTNTRKHSEANHVSVSLTHSSGDLRIVISDDGRGFGATGVIANGPGIGLLSMRERAAALHGECSIVSKPGAGTSVTVTIPAGIVAR